MIRHNSSCEGYFTSQVWAVFHNWCGGHQSADLMKNQDQRLLPTLHKEHYTKPQYGRYWGAAYEPETGFRNDATRHGPIGSKHA